jgi:hypothetical protein
MESRIAINVMKGWVLSHQDFTQTDERLLPVRTELLSALPLAARRPNRSMLRTVTLEVGRRGGPETRAVGFVLASEANPVGPS